MESDLTKRKILIVEDEKDLMELYLNFFDDEFVDHEKVSVESVAQAKEFLTIVNIRLIDVIILDGSLPDGWAGDVISLLEFRGFGGGIIVVTGGLKQSLSPDFIDQIAALFKKPVALEPLFSMMHHCIKEVERRLKD
jgi:DNA-binding NtrC family response regulator